MAGERVVLGFVAAVLLLLAVTPLAFDRVTEPHRDYIESVVQPTGESVRAVEARLTEEVALSRGYLLTREEQFLDQYRRVQGEQRSTLESLRRRAARLEAPRLETSLERLATLVRERHEPVTELRRGEITPEAYIDRLSSRQELLASTTRAAQQAAAELTDLERSERERIRTLRRYQNWMFGVLVGLAALSVLAIARVAARLRRTSEEEASLRRVASVMNAALGVDQIARWVGGNAGSLLGADAIIVELADPDRLEVEIAAATGESAGLSRTRVRYPGALTAAQCEDGGPRRIDPIEQDETPTGVLLASRYAGHSGAVFPLMSDGGAMGSLVALRRPGRSAPADAEMRRGEVLADLTALAMRKILLLERSQIGLERAEHLLASRSRLIRGLSHDLRNPLGAVLGYAELLEDVELGELDSGHRDYVRRIRRAAAAMDDIIRHLVEVGKSDTAEVPLQVEPVSVQRLVQEIVDEHRGEAERRGLQLATAFPADLPTVESDPIHIRTIVGNLLSNALKYTARGTVEVRAELVGARGSAGGDRRIRIAVRDTGPGIAPEDQETIFEEFSRVGGTRAPGEGIGLASARRSARRLGGDLHLESAPGTGSTFALLLPADAGSPSFSGASAM